MNWCSNTAMKEEMVYIVNSSLADEPLGRKTTIRSSPLNKVKVTTYKCWPYHELKVIIDHLGGNLAFESVEEGINKERDGSLK